MDIFVKKPVLAIVISLIIIIAGAMASQRLPISQFPQIESSSLVISTEYVGVSADVVKGFVTEPIERVAMSVPGVDYIDSTTTAGLSKVTVWLKLNENSTDALAELNSRLGQISYELPDGAQDPSVSVTRVDRPGATFYLNVSSATMDRAELTDFLEREVTPWFASVEGVQSADVLGGRKPAIRVWLDPLKMASLNIGAHEVHQALNDNNVIASLGHVESATQNISIMSNALHQNTEDFRKLIVKKSGDTFVYLGDIARIELGEDRGTDSARLDLSESVFIGIVTAPGSNEISIGDALYKQLAAINARMPEGTAITIGYDGTQYMRDALKEIFTTLIETVLLVGFVILLLMGSFRTALIPLVTIPISILGSTAAILLAGFALNLLTILAIVLSVGLVVDDAIVVVENVARHMRNGKGRIEAALISSRELIRPIFSMTITLALVFAPIGFVSGLSGALFKEFAFTLAIAVLFSGVVAVTLSPIMSAYVSQEKGKEGRLTRKVNRAFDHLSVLYENGLYRVFSYRRALITSAVVLSLLIVPFYLFSQKELAPVEDQSSLFVISEAPSGSSLDYSTPFMQEAVGSILQMDGVDNVWQTVTESGGFSGINFVPYEQRSYSTSDALQQIYFALKQITGLRVYPTAPMPLPTAGQFDVEMVIQSQDSYTNMTQYAYQLLEAAQMSGMFMFVDTDLKVDMPHAQLEFDNKKMMDLGLTTKAVTDQISLMVSEQDVTRFDSHGKAYRVIPMVDKQTLNSSESLLTLQIKTPNGDFVPLNSIANLQQTIGVRSIARFNQLNSFRILGGLVPGTTPDQALNILERKAEEILPQDYQVNYAGSSRQLRQEGNSLFSMLAVALFVVYMVLSIQFNSFRAPLVVLLGSVPLALAGGMSFSFLGMTTMNIYAQIGFITLVGLVAKNGILITEFANELQYKGYQKLDAIVHSAKLRLRPILMTTAATVLGHFPLVLVVGPGAEARNSIGIILVAGMIIGTVFTLFVLPAVYLALSENVNKPISSSIDTDQALVTK
ncbi:efflux RND transporter permease subunit [Photobacterium sp. OFAV2-7]|uniref:efflux RND transporter permease subunit n=1 Tax=Photobacterium sp. OFAV2-7 TaxID=2917748 RepID=UPI001EF4A607|nr:efflux RND transporter permease subunit [Photobacterium sp. OFAV2-7]MCG7584338.1 efflux RND transporter permease subunit [Photobacterium sp. OFAV2-7]